MEKNKVSIHFDNVGDFLAKFAEHSEHVYWISTPDFKTIQYISPSFERIWGRTREELYNNPEIWVNFLHPDDVHNRNPIQDMAEKVKLLKDKARYSENYRIIRPNGEIRWISDNGFPLFDDSGVCHGVAGIAIDVTPQKEYVLALQQAKEAAETANLAKDEFIANMSHDIRTPLTGIIGMADLLSQTLENPEEKERAEMLRVSGEELLSLLNGVLEVVRISRAQEKVPHPTTFSLKTLLEAAVNLERPTVLLKKLAIYLDLPENLPDQLYGDSVKLQRIVLNLLGNAVKFTMKGEIRVSAQVIKESDDMVLIALSVKDTGIGIAKKAIPHIFEKFYRVNPSYKGTYGGFGIGLHVVKQYVEYLQGTIHASSEIKKGTTITVTIPFKRASEVASSPLPSQSMSNEPQVSDRAPLLLLVEDNAVALKIAEALCHKGGYSFKSARSAEEAYELYSRYPFSLILTDLGLPGLSGNELALKIRRDEKTQHLKPIPIVGFTAHMLKTAEAGSLEAGMNQVLTKPLSMKKLTQLIKTYSIPTQTPLSEAVPLLDEKIGIQQVGTEETFHELLAMMAESLPHEIERMKEAFAQKDWELLHHQVHQLKSSTLYCGTIELHRLCEVLEQAYHQKEFSLLAKEFPVFISVAEQTLGCLIQALKK